jgi:hypothetical protein
VESAGARSNVDVGANRANSPRFHLIEFRLITLILEYVKLASLGLIT